MNFVVASASLLVLLSGCDSAPDPTCGAGGAWRTAPAGGGLLAKPVFTADGGLNVLHRHESFDDITGETSTALGWSSGWNGDEWSDGVNLDPDGESHGVPSVVVVGDTVHVAWTATHEGARAAVYYATSTDGRAFSAPVNLTAAFEEPDARRAGGVALAAGPEGEVALVYGSYSSDGDDDQLRTARVVDGALASDPVVAMPGPCSGEAAFDSAGHLHVVVGCSTGLEESDIVWATDASGSWQSETLSRSGTSARPALATGANGTIHALLPIMSGDIPELEYCRLVDGQWSDGETLAARTQKGDIATGPDGTIAVAFERRDEVDVSEALLVTSCGGSGFGGETSLIRKESNWEWITSTSVAIDPAAATPVLATTFRNTDYDDEMVLGWFQR